MGERGLYNAHKDRPLTCPLFQRGRNEGSKDTADPSCCWPACLWSRRRGSPFLLADTALSQGAQLGRQSADRISTLNHRPVQRPDRAGGSVTRVTSRTRRPRWEPSTSGRVSAGPELPGSPLSSQAAAALQQPGTAPMSSASVSGPRAADWPLGDEGGEDLPSTES